MIKREDGKIQSYIWDSGALFMEENGESYSYLNDLQGSAMRLLNHGGEDMISYRYDEFGADLSGNQGQFQPLGYTGYQKDVTAGTYYAQAREYDAWSGRFVSKDRDEFINLYNNMTENLYMFCLNNPLKYIDCSGHEVIVVTGGNDDESEFDYQFVEPAIKNMRDEIANGTPAEDITWMVVNVGYDTTEEEIKEKINENNFKDTAKKLGVNIVTVSDKNAIINYFNKKDITGSSNHRYDDKITSVSFYCHGMTKMISARGGENQLGLAYNIKNFDSSKVNFLQSDIEKLETSAFANTRTMFYSCNAGTKEYIIKGKSFAQVWVNKTGGQATGIVNGRTSYANINSYVSGFGGTKGFQLDIFSKILSMVGFNSSKQIIKEDRENNGKGYSEYGSLYNPVMASPDLVNHFWDKFSTMGTVFTNLSAFDYSWIDGHWEDFYPEECN